MAWLLIPAIALLLAPQAIAQPATWLFGAADAQYERAAHLLREGQIDEAFDKVAGAMVSSGAAA